MLRALDIRDILIIDRLSIEFQPGLNVLTGETGAGKSILLDSLGFVLGWRGRAELVRQGAEQGEVMAEFDLPETHAVAAVLDEAGVPFDGELLLRRVNRADGRKTAWINDRRVSGEVLRAVSGHLIELHGQHDDRGLLNPSGHRRLLDEFGELGKELKGVQAAWNAWRGAETRFAEVKAALAAVAEEEDFLRHSVAELDALSPEAGEEAVLDSRRRLMQGAEKIREDVAKAAVAVSGQGAEGQMTDALRWLEEVEAEETKGPIASLERSLSELAEAQAGIEDLLARLSFNPHELEETEERLFALRALARKHSVLPDDLPALADQLRERLNTLDAGADGLAALEAEVSARADAYGKASDALSKARAKAGKALDKLMAAELAPLKMDRALFKTQITPEDPGPQGTDGVTFSVATNPGAPAGPLGKIASGGELSRFLLALKVCLTRESDGLTLIFDEIDRGVGGATADAVGKRLASLASEGQVLVVTHSPQVAARARHHWRVEKQQSKDETLSTVIPLAEPDRIDEIARMLSGDRITDEARAAARALMDA